MTDLNTILYAGNVLGPQAIAGNTNDVYESGFTTVLLGLSHIGRGPDAKDPIPGQKTGDIIFNDPSQGGVIVVSDGQYVGPVAWPGQLQELFAADRGKGQVKLMGCSIGGGGCEDYQTIWGNFVVNGSIGTDTALYRNFVALRKTLPFLEFIDFDCEEFDSSYYPDYQWNEVLVAFGNMLKSVGFSLTFCPYCESSEWMGVLKKLYAPQAPTVRWMNLQCYDGGGSNDPGEWAAEVNRTGLGIDGDAFTVPGLWCCNTAKPDCGSTPPEMQDRFTTWTTDDKIALQGGFVWNYDDILANEASTACDPSYTGPKSAAAYQNALIRGLTLRAAASPVDAAD
jgi:hypothetical protein